MLRLNSGSRTDGTGARSRVQALNACVAALD